MRRADVPSYRAAGPSGPLSMTCMQGGTRIYSLLMKDMKGPTEDEDEIPGPRYPPAAERSALHTAWYTTTAAAQFLHTGVLSEEGN